MFAKQIIEVGSGDNQIQTTLASNIEIEYDLDNIAPTASFKLPYKINSPEFVERIETTVEEGLDLRTLKKYDTIKIYYNEFDIDPGDVTITAHSEHDTMVSDEQGNIFYKIFDGYIDSITLSVGKLDIDYSISALGILAITNERNAPININTRDTNIAYIMQELLQIANVQIGTENIPDSIPRNLIPISRMVTKIDIERPLTFVIKGGKNAKEAIDSIKERYGVFIFQGVEGFVYTVSPLYLIQGEVDEQGNQTATAWDFDMAKGNIYSINYGDLTSYINSVVVLGYPGTAGVAVDIIGVQRSGGNLNYQIFERAELAGSEDCEKVAQDLLLKILQNNEVSIRTKFNPQFNLTHFFTIKDYNKFTGNELFLIKRIAIKISKNDVSCKLTGYTHSLTTLPQDLVISPTGVADVDYLEIKSKLPDETIWNNFGGL